MGALSFTRKLDRGFGGRDIFLKLFCFLYLVVSNGVAISKAPVPVPFARANGTAGAIVGGEEN